MRATVKASAPDPLVSHLAGMRDEALSNVRALLAPDAPPVSGYFPRETQIENHLKAAEAAQRRLTLFGLGG